MSNITAHAVAKTFIFLFGMTECMLHVLVNISSLYFDMKFVTCIFQNTDLKLLTLHYYNCLVLIYYHTMQIEQNMLTINCSFFGFFCFFVF